MMYVQQWIIVEDNVLFKVIYSLIIVSFFTYIYLVVYGEEFSHVWKLSKF